MWRPSFNALRRSSSTRLIHPKTLSQAGFTRDNSSPAGEFPFSDHHSSSLSSTSTSSSSSPSLLKARDLFFSSDESFLSRNETTDTSRSGAAAFSGTSTDSGFSGLHQDKEERRSALAPLSTTSQRGSSRMRKQGLKFPLLPVPSRRVIIQQLNDPIPTSSTSTTTSTADSSPLPLTGRQLWGATRLARENKHVRRSQQVCVVGGKESIQRIWNEYHIRPHVVYVSNIRGIEEEEEEEVEREKEEEESREEGSHVSHNWNTSSDVPSWCLSNHDLPTYIVRCPPVDIQRHLLSASLSTPYAAEFPWHPSQLLPLSYALKTQVEKEATGKDTSQEMSSSASSPHHSPSSCAMEKGEKNIPSMLVLVGLRIPSNVGMLIHAAEVMGFSSVALIHCVDPFQEKVLRASYGSVLSPHLQLYEYEDQGSGVGGANPPSSLVSTLCTIAAQHQLMPFLAVPSQEEEPAFEVAKRFHSFNATARAQKEEIDGEVSSGSASRVSSSPTPVGPMLVLGGESRGLEVLADAPWTVPYQTLTLPIPNATVDSFNVGVAGSILMDLFRPSAEKHFKQVQQITGPSPIPLVEENQL